MIIETNTHFFNYEIGANSIQWIEKRNLGRIGSGKKYADTSFVYEDMTDYEKEWAVNPFVGEPGVIVQELDGSPSSLVQTIKVPNGSLTIVGTTATLVFSTEVEAHADSHVDGTDDIQSATAAQKGLATAAQITKLDGIESSATADQSAVEIKTAYETNADTNAYNDAAVSKLGGIEALADVTDATNVNAVETDPVVGAVSGIVKANGAGVISAATANTDYQSPPSEGAFANGDKTKLDAIEALADVTASNETSHSDVLVDGDFTAADEIMVGTGIGTHGQVTLAASQFLAKKDAGAATNVTATEARAILNVADGANAYVHPNHSGEVTSSADGAQTITNKAVTLAKMNDMATASLLGRNTAAVGVPEVLAKATALSLLNVADGADVTSTNETSHAAVLVDGDFNAKGDLLSASANDTPLILTVGANDLVLTAASGEATGLKWAAAGGAAALPTNYITDLILSNDTDVDNDINIAAGKCRDSTDTVDIVLAAEITKQIDSAFVAGNDAGGLDTGAVAAAKVYSMWLIKRSDTGVVDALFSLSMTAPTMPANYDYKRFIGYVWTLDAAATIKPFIMTESGEIWFTKASQCIVVTGAKTSYTSYAESPVDLSGDLPTGHYDSVLFGCKAATTATIINLSSDGTNNISNSHAAFANLADSEYAAWEGGSAAVGFHFIPLKVADTVYMEAITQDGNNVSLLIHAVKLKYR